MNNRRVVITGMGTITPIGNNLNDFWDGMLKGRNGVGLITKFDTTNFETKFAAEVKDFRPENYLDKKIIRRLDLFTRYSIVAAEMALKDSEINLEKVNKEKIQRI